MSNQTRRSEIPVAVKSLTRRFGRKVALDEISLEITPGQVFGLVGENGAGKTTLIRHILGLLKAQSGSVRVFGTDPVSSPEQALVRIGYLSETRDLPEWMRVREVMLFTQPFFPNWDTAYAEELRTMFDLDPGAKIRTLSRGQKAQVGLILALAHRPELLVLDEPSSGLDAVVRRDILSAIIRTVADEGRTVLFSSHLLDEVELVADHVAMIHLGHVVMSEPLDTIKARHRFVTMKFPEAVPMPPRVEGAISCDGEGQEWTLLWDGDLSGAREAVQRLGARVIEEEPASLEDIFVARVRGHRAVKAAGIVR